MFSKYIEKCNQRNYSRGSHSCNLVIIYHQLQVQKTIREVALDFFESILANVIKENIAGDVTLAI